MTSECSLRMIMRVLILVSVCTLGVAANNVGQPTQQKGQPLHTAEAAVEAYHDELNISTTTTFSYEDLPITDIAIRMRPKEVNWVQSPLPFISCSCGVMDNAGTIKRTTRQCSISLRSPTGFECTGSMCTRRWDFVQDEMGPVGAKTIQFVDGCNNSSSNYQDTIECLHAMTNDHYFCCLSAWCNVNATRASGLVTPARKSNKSHILAVAVGTLAGFSMVLLCMVLGTRIFRRSTIIRRYLDIDSTLKDSGCCGSMLGKSKKYLFTRPSGSRRSCRKNRGPGDGSLKNSQQAFYPQSSTSAAGTTSVLGCSGTDTGNRSLHRMIEEFSGSGSGLPLLVQRTLARQIQLVDVIGKGRFGEVWKGVWHDEPVAVKIFSARDERSWFRETEIYQTALNRHVNILGFIAADNKDTGSWTQLWLVTDYHSNGSLYDFLLVNELKPAIMFKMLLSITTGLNHLHMPIEGCEGKPAIAHRDLKSKNILVKADLTCCVADFGLAVKHDPRTDQMDILPNPKAGTNRYMAPECLIGHLEENSFESFKQCDVYSFGLIAWEIINRTKYDESDNVPSYAPPYNEYAPCDPTVEEMLDIVCVRGLRPRFRNGWNKTASDRRLLKVVEECWYQEPSARLATLRVKKNLGNLAREVEDQTTPSPLVAV